MRGVENVNKDFFKKPISLKDINLKNINLKNLKNIKNKKEILIVILMLVYIVIVFLTGNALINTRGKAKSEYQTKLAEYNSLVNSLSEDKIKEKINELELEQENLAKKIEEVDNTKLREILTDFKKGAFITWEDEEIMLRSETKEFEDYDIYVVNIKSFSGSLEQIESFLEYVDNYSRIVRVDTITFRQNQITGKLSGQLKLSFYFKKLS